MPDLNKIYRLILADILERLKEHSIGKKEAISRIEEASCEYFVDVDDNVMFIHYTQEHYPQYYKELT